MSGILDKKTRFIDFTLTEHGRKSLEDGYIDFSHASFSDKSILYEKDEILSQNKKSDVAFTGNYLPLENDSKSGTIINVSPNLDKLLSHTFDESNYNYNLTIDANVSEKFLQSFSIGANIKSLGLLANKNKIKEEEIEFVDDLTFYSDFDFKNSNFVSEYPTIKSVSINDRDLESILKDERFSNKKTFKKLVPVDKDNNSIYEEDYFSEVYEYEKPSLYNIFKRLKGFNYSLESLNDIVLESISVLEKNNNILRKKYVLKNESEFDSFIVNLYEETNSQSISLQKLSIIDIGDFYDKENACYKKVFLAGKIINTSSEIDTEKVSSLYSFNLEEITKNTKNTNFAISEFYSFVCLFTIVAERS